MPNLAQAKKALRQSQKRARKNLLQKSEIASMRRQLRKLIEANKLEEANTALVLLQKKLDKAVKKGVMKKNTVSRTLSRAAKTIGSAVKSK